MSDQEMKEQIYEEMAEMMAAPPEEPDWQQFGMILQAMQAMLEPLREQANGLTTADLLQDPSVMRDWAILQNIVEALRHIQAAVELIQEEKSK